MLHRQYKQKYLHSPDYNTPLTMFRIKNIRLVFIILLVPNSDVKQNE